MADTITITKEEAAIFRSFILEKIGEYSKNANIAAETGYETGYHTWVDAVDTLETLDCSLGERMEVIEE